MKIKSGFSLMNVCGEHVVIASGESNINFTKVISLNVSAADVWKAIEGKDFTIDDAAKALTDNYEVDAQTAQADAENLIAQWREAGLLD